MMSPKLIQPEDAIFMDFISQLYSVQIFRDPFPLGSLSANGSMAAL